MTKSLIGLELLIFKNGGRKEMTWMLINAHQYRVSIISPSGDTRHGRCYSICHGRVRHVGLWRVRKWSVFENKIKRDYSLHPAGSSPLTKGS